MSSSIGKMAQGSKYDCSSKDGGEAISEADDRGVPCCGVAELVELGVLILLIVLRVFNSNVLLEIVFLINQ